MKKKKIIEGIAIFSLLLNFMGCPSENVKPENKEKNTIRLEHKSKNGRVNESKGIARVINYHYGAALRGEEIRLVCSQEYQDFKICLIDGAYCLAEKKFDFAIKNFEQALIEAEKINEDVEGVLYYYLGLSYEMNSSTEEAKKAYEKSFEFNKKIGYKEGSSMAKESLERISDK